MTDRYVGPGGSDSNDGLSWANRKLTLTGVEDTPVVAGDTVYVGPGTYRETLTLDVSGSSGNEITYIGDVTGINTDGVGGEVRITRSTDDEAPGSGASFIIGVERDYRTFRGFHLEWGWSYSVAGNLAAFDMDRCDNLVIEDCVIGFEHATLSYSAAYWCGVRIKIDANSWNTTIRRCEFNSQWPGIIIGPYDASTYTTNIVVENCIFFGITGYEMSDTAFACIQITDISGMTIANCTFISNWAFGVDVESSFLKSSASGTNYLYNCVIAGARSDVAAGDFTEDYNSIMQYAKALDADFTNGGNSDNHAVLLNPPVLIKGHIVDWRPGELAPYSPVIGKACNSSAPSDDFFGITRPTSDAKKTRGAIQNSHIEKDTTTIEGDWPYSIKMNDAMAYQFIVPTTGNQMSFEVNVRREADYTGTLPQMIIKQPGQSDRTTTDTGSVSVWNGLSDAYTPASTTPYVIVELRSDNTATSGNYAVNFSSLSIK